MTLDVKGLLPGAAQPEPGAGHPPVGRRTADSPFAVLLASAAPGRAARAGTPAPIRPPSLDVRAAMAQAIAVPGAADPGLEIAVLRHHARGAAPRTPAAELPQADGDVTALPDVVPSADGAAPAPPALEEPFGTPRAHLEPRLAGEGKEPELSEEAQEVTESSLLASPAPIPAPAGTGVPLPIAPGRLLADARAPAPGQVPSDQAIPHGLEPGPGHPGRRVKGAARPGHLSLPGRSSPLVTGQAGAHPGHRSAELAAAQARPASTETPAASLEARVAPAAPDRPAPELRPAPPEGHEVAAHGSGAPAAPAPSSGDQASPAHEAAKAAATSEPSVQRPAAPAPRIVDPPAVRPGNDRAPAPGLAAATTPPRTRQPADPRTTPAEASASTVDPRAVAAETRATPADPKAVIAEAGTTSVAPRDVAVAAGARAIAVEAAPRPTTDAPPPPGSSSPPAAAHGPTRADRGRPEQEGEPRGQPRQPPPPRSEAAPAAHRTVPAPPPAVPGPALSGQVAARELGTSARLTQAAQGGAQVREPTERKPARAAREAEPSGASLPAQHAAAPAPEPSARPAAAPARAAPPLPPELPQSLAGGTILPHAAHVRLESATLGDLALHLRVRDGVAHVRVEGDQAAQVAGHGQELQRALAAEGLKLGRLEVDRPQAQATPTTPSPHAAADQQLPQGHGERPEREEPAHHGPAQPAPGRRPSGRTTAHHVEA